MNALDYAKEANRIFVLSDSFIRIKELIDCDTSTIDDIGDVITLDPALASTVLKLANSSFFNYPGKIDTVSKAVLILGITEVYNLVIAYFTTEAFKDISADISYLDEFWENAVNTALLVKFIGNKMSMRQAERLFILGLLHNLGELVIQQFNPDALAECSDHSITTLPWEKQRKVLGFTFGDVTAELIKLWNLPVSISHPIARQDTVHFLDEASEVKLLYIAKRAMWHGSYFSRQGIQELLDLSYLEAEGLTVQDIDEAHAYSDMEKLAILNLLNPGATTIY